MPFLNFKYGFVIYEDRVDNKNPNIRIPDISNDIQNVTVNNDKSERITVYPNEVKDIATTTRPLLWDNTTELQFIRPFSAESIVRVRHTGTGAAPNFRTNRNIGGDTDTEVTISRLSDYVARIQNTGGTAWDLSAVQINDIIQFSSTNDLSTSPFSETNAGREYVVQAKGSDYIDFIDNSSAVPEGPVVLGADFAQILKVVSQGSVKVGDLIEINGNDINPSNHGKFEIVSVSDNYVDIINPFVAEETVLIDTNTFVIYEHLIGFIHLRANGAFKVKFGEQQEWVSIDMLGKEAVFIGSICTHRILSKNDGPDPVTVSIQHAMVSSV